MPNLLSIDAIRRICRSLILTEQEALVRLGHMNGTHLDHLRRPGLTPEMADELAISEDVLGFDSLSIQGLILRFDQFFGLSRTGIEDYLYVQRQMGDWVTLIEKHLEMMGDAQVFTFLTSGSAGPAKSIAHHCENLAQEVAALNETVFAVLPQNRRFLTLVPPHHIYGFIFSCLIPHAGRHDVIEVGPALTSVTRQAARGDIIIGTPWNWKQIARARIALPADVHGIVSGGPIDTEVWQVSEICGLASMTEIYGATETGGIGWRTHRSSGFNLLPHLERRGKDLFRAADQNTKLSLQDHLTWDGPTTFRVDGRIDDVVQVAGMNVSPQKVRHHIISIPEVHDCAVRLNGERLKAYVVPQNGTEPESDALECAIIETLRTVLPPVAIPQSIRFGPTLPRNSMGKLCDWTI